MQMVTPAAEFADQGDKAVANGKEKNVEWFK